MIGVQLILHLTIEVVCLQCSPGEITRLDDRPERGEQWPPDGVFQLLNIRVRLGARMIDARVGVESAAWPIVERQQSPEDGRLFAPCGPRENVI